MNENCKKAKNTAAKMCIKQIRRASRAAFMLLRAANGSCEIFLLESERKLSEKFKMQTKIGFVRILHANGSNKTYFSRLEKGPLSVQIFTNFDNESQNIFCYCCC